jgi:hypothetical protein
MVQRSAVNTWKMEVSERKRDGVMGDDKVLDGTAPVLGISRPRHRDESKQLEAGTQALKPGESLIHRRPKLPQTPRSVVGLKFAYVTM